MKLSIPENIGYLHFVHGVSRGVECRNRPVYYSVSQEHFDRRVEAVPHLVRYLASLSAACFDIRSYVETRKARIITLRQF